MSNATNEAIPGPGSTPNDVLQEVLREGAQQMLVKAIHDEVAAYINEHADQVDANGHRLVTRNGHKKQRTIETGVGPIDVQQPRIDDRRVDENGQRLRFTSKILPPYLRRTKSIDELVPWLYLKGISTGDFSECLRHLVGTESAGLSPTTVVRLKETWSKEQQEWARRSLEGKRYVYIWADGIHFNIRLEEDKQCILVVLGATADGKKELLAIADGYRESAQSWKEVLLDLRARGLEKPPKLAVGDGALGFWKALAEVFANTPGQRCWVHKTANVLAKLPKNKQSVAKEAIQEIWMAATRADANKAFDLFVEKYEAKYPKAVACLTKDRQELLVFYDFPAEHWKHLRTSNPIESIFSTVRLRHRRTKGSGSRVACFAMVFKLVQSAAKRWRRLTGHALITDVIQGVQFTDGIKENAA
ncbi:MAG: IS256 family transposase [Planctomycetota bacterium]